MLDRLLDSLAALPLVPTYLALMALSALENVFPPVPPFAGVAKVPVARALVPAAVASLLWYAFLGVAGYALAANWEAAKTIVAEANRALGIAAAVATAAVAVWLWRRSRRRAA